MQYIHHTYIVHLLLTLHIVVHEEVASFSNCSFHILIAKKQNPNDIYDRLDRRMDRNTGASSTNSTYETTDKTNVLFLLLL